MKPSEWIGAKEETIGALAVIVGIVLFFWLGPRYFPGGRVFAGYVRYLGAVGAGMLCGGLTRLTLFLVRSLLAKTGA